MASSTIRITEECKQRLDEYFGNDFKMSYSDKIEHLLTLLVIHKSEPSV